jgi:hypothetical protein
MRRRAVGRKRHVRLALAVLAVALLLPAGAVAAPACDSGPGPVPYYSPWHYRTPLLSRFCEEYRLRRERKCNPVYYPPGPYSYQIITCPGAPVEEPDFRSRANPTPQATAAEAAGR